MKTSVAVFDGDLVANEVQEVAVDLSDFKSGVLWASKESGTSLVNVVLLAVEEGFDHIGTGFQINLGNNSNRLSIPALPDQGYAVRVQAGSSAATGVKVSFVGDDQAVDSGGFTINLTGTVEKE